MRKDSNLKEEYKLFKDTLNQINNYFNDLSKENHLDTIDKTLSINKEKYLNNYILNSIVNYANYHYEKESKSVLRKDDVIKSIVLNIYNKHKKLSRKQIVINSFNNNYILANEFKNAIRNINKELEQAAEEFYKMNGLDKQEAKVKTFLIIFGITLLALIMLFIFCACKLSSMISEKEREYEKDKEDINQIIWQKILYI